MKILSICDSFKGTLSSKEIGEIICEHYTKVGHLTKAVPISDGGEGFLDVISYLTNSKYLECIVNDPLFRQTTAKYIYTEDTKTIYLELAEASGITKVKKEERNASFASTYGLGELIKHVILTHKPKKIILGIGGSATTDMGSGMLEAMGVEFIDANGFLLRKMNNVKLLQIRKIKNRAFKKLIKGIEFVTLTDVLNPAFGKYGTVRVFSKQKGASEDDFVAMEKNITHFHNKTKDLYKDRITDFEGAGAAGGVGYTMKHYFNSSIKSGIDTILELINFDSLVKEYDIVISGEGRLDEQSLNGKVISGISKYNPKRLILISGSTTLKLDYQEIYSIVPSITTLEDSIANPKENLIKLLDQIKL